MYWKYGFVFVGDRCDSKSINYMLKYVTKVDNIHKGYQSKIFTSAGIGRKFLTTSDKDLNEFKGPKTQEYIIAGNNKINLPIYYRNKLFSEREREELWINTLNKNRRYVLGEKIDVGLNEAELS